MKLGTEVGLGPRHSVKWGPSSPSPKEAQPPNFRPVICCGQMARWIKVSFGMEVGLSFYGATMTFKDGTETVQVTSLRRTLASSP